MYGNVGMCMVSMSMMSVWLLNTPGVVVLYGCIELQCVYVHITRYCV